MDRNTSIDNLTQGVFKSLSARRAWIEMQVFQRIAKPFRSLSARRAWIEMMISVNKITYQRVALRKESVDRNRQLLPESLLSYCRSPQGERG